jgi:hypothetical protein
MIIKNWTNDYQFTTDAQAFPSYKPPFFNGFSYIFR